MRVLFRGLSAALLSVAVLAPGALAAPVTVDLRVEGPTRTVFEGRVTTDVRPWKFTNESTEHECNGTASTGGPSSVPVPTRASALMDAVYGPTPFSVTGTWYSFGPAISEIGGENVNYDGGSGRYLAEFHNWQFDTSYGACSRQVGNGDVALFAYSTGSEPLLKLSGPATARPGETATVKVVDGRDESPIAGASVGGRLTGADGTAVVGPFSERGENPFKAEKSGTVRSNRLSVCVSDGQDGFCGNRTADGGGGTGSDTAAPPADRTDPLSAITGIREGQIFRRRKAPRVLRGEISDDSALRFVKLRLTRRAGDKCGSFSRSRERFLPRRCGVRHGWWFRIGDSADWEYQLASRLPRGRYVLDVKAWDRSWNVDAERKRGQNRVVFRVR